MYRALYRKYRPADFNDVYGQPHIVRTLKNQLEQNKLSHAYLFTGSRGTGKTTCAKILAKAVNCLDLQQGNPCNKCEMCKQAAADSLIDITEIDAASNNGVDDIRELRDNTAYTPVNAKYRVFIIDEVHMLSNAAFNALLKTLEEPPEHVIFILATTEVHKLPATILSRCQRFDFRRITPEDIMARLKQVAQIEKIDLTDEGAFALAKLADGALRDALSLLDICAAEGGKIDGQKVYDVAGLSGREYLSSLALAIANRDVNSSLEIIKNLYERSKDLSRLCTEMVSYFRDLMMVKTLENAESFVPASKEEIERISQMADIMGVEKIIHAIDVFEETLLKISNGAERRTAVERALIILCCPELDTSYSALLSRIAALEKGGTSMAVSTSVPTPAPVVQKSESVQDTEDKPLMPVLEPESEQKQQTDADIGQSGEFSQWTDVLSELTSTDKMLKAALKGSVAYIQGDLMLIDIANESFKDMINGESRHRTALKQAIFKVTGKNYRIGPYTKKAVKKEEEDPLDKIILNARNNGLM